MSSIRVAVGSCVLVLALGASAWGAVEAFPLYGESHDQQPARDPQRPPRDSLSVGHRINLDFENADLRAVLRVFANESGLDINIHPQVEGRVNVLMHDVPWDQALDRILRSHKLGYTVDGNMLRIAPLGADGKQSQQQKDRLRERALTRANMPPPPPPPAPVPGLTEIRPEGVPPPPPPSPQPPAGWADYQALLDQYKPLRIGGELRAPMKTRDVKPVYPPIAQASRVQGVVIVEAIIDAGGRVVDARVLRSIPLLNEAALDAVKQWEYTPTLMNGVPTAVVMTVTVNFSLQ